MAHVTYKGKKIKVIDKVLDLSSRGIESITDIVGLAQLTDLHELNLNTNYITAIKGLECLKGLRRLYLSYNCISEIRGLNSLVNLEVLDLSNPREYLSYDRSGDDYLQSRNYISPITELKGLETLVNLKVLNLKGNKVKKITGLENLSNLETLDLSKNRISMIEGLSTLKNLKELYLNKQLTDKIYLRPLGFTTFSIKGLEGLTNLQKIDLKCDWEFEINEYLTVRLSGGTRKPTIHVAGKRIRECAYLLSETPTEKFSYVNVLESIDDIDVKMVLIDVHPPEDHFWGICSNLQVWAEHNYKTLLLSMFLAFPLLKKLTEAGDLIAKSAFKDEISRRFRSGHLHVAIFLIEEGYMEFLNYEEQEFLFKELIETSNNRSPKKWNSLGVRFEKLSNYDNAIKCYKRALELNSEYEIALKNLKRLI